MMNSICKKYRNLDFSAMIIAGTPMSDLLEELLEHQHACDECDAWYRKKMLANRRIDPELYCCLSMAEQLNTKCEQHPDPWDCPDYLVIQLKTGHYGLPIRDGGTSYLEITHCPWCGSKFEDKIQKPCHLQY